MPQAGNSGGKNGNGFTEEARKARIYKKMRPPIGDAFRAVGKEKWGYPRCRFGTFNVVSSSSLMVTEMQTGTGRIQVGPIPIVFLPILARRACNQSTHFLLVRFNQPPRRTRKDCVFFKHRQNILLRTIKRAFGLISASYYVQEDIVQH